MQGSGGPGGSSLLSSRFLGVLLFCGYVDIVAGGGVVSAVGVLALDCAADVAQVSVAVSVYCFFLCGHRWHNPDEDMRKSNFCTNEMKSS